MSEKPEAWRAIDSLIWPHIAAKLVRRQHAEIERLHDELRQSSIDIARAENERLREALESIAANACCDRCQEAALVAKAALRRED